MDRESVSFQTRARTVDHLGREQIADCPTAISELWKNAYDAYARNVEMHIFDGEVEVAALFDDGHGMSRNEFESKWLTIGTESKTSGFEVATEDTDGLAYRAKQGQKGIGRLSSAALGSLLLIVSKRKNNDFVVALIDWRLFENPFLLLHDVRIPVLTFNSTTELADKLPILFDKMMGNIWGEPDDESRNARLANAWELFSEQELADGSKSSTQDSIINTLIADVFTERHFNKWTLWNGESSQGTAMFMANIHDDIHFQLSKTPIEDASGPEKLAKERFFHTLSNFTDPFSKANENQAHDFSNKVISWHSNMPRPIIDEVREFDLNNLDNLEHIVEGTVDVNGEFNGRVKVFGEWHEDYKVKPKTLYKTRRDSAFGTFHIRIGTFELLIGSTTLPDELHASFKEQADKYAGLRVYRDGLRVMPYGRVDSDYFEVEYRRSKNAGRYFWANRRIFGRVSISRENNPNLKDKAGREGFLENRASKLFREIVENILTSIADRHLGSKSDNRKPVLADIKEKKNALKAEEDRKKLQTKERQRIRSSIKKKATQLNDHALELEVLQKQLSVQLENSNLSKLQEFKKNIDALNNTTKSFSLSPIPSNLGRLEDDYRAYRKDELRAKDSISELSFAINKAIEKSTERSDYEKAEEVYRSKLASLNSRITRLASDGKEILAKQNNEFTDLVKYCREQFKTTTSDYLEDLKLEKISLNQVLLQLDEDQEKVDVENQQRLSPYVTALSMINEQIDLEGLAVHSMNETLKVKEELARLHGLAQLGITVEIVGHEIEGLDMTINRGLKTIASGGLSSLQKEAYSNVLHAQESLSDKWRFLSPLKLSGERTTKRITGSDIFNYVKSYFEETLQNNNISLFATDNFLNIAIQDQPSRIYPVFINMINNSQYWVTRNDSHSKEIVIDYISGEVYISDTGPGVDRDDLDQLFTLFFTRKQRGGRGIGLYLCRQNLLAGGHSIRYETTENKKVLNGANFAIKFKGLNNE